MNFQGLHPVDKEIACQLGALQCQIQYGDFPYNKPKFQIEYVSTFTFEQKYTSWFSSSILFHSKGFFFANFLFLKIRIFGFLSSCPVRIFLKSYLVFLKVVSAGFCSPYFVIGQNAKLPQFLSHSWRVLLHTCPLSLFPPVKLIFDQFLKSQMLLSRERETREGKRKKSWRNLSKSPLI